VVYDCWSPYDAFTDADHELCCAHAIPELVAVAEKAAPEAWCWAGPARDALVDLQHLALDGRAAGAGAVGPAATAEPLRRFRHAVQIGISQTAPRTTTPMRAENALGRRLADREADYLRFLSDLTVPPDNNGSERDIKMVKHRADPSRQQRGHPPGPTRLCCVLIHMWCAELLGPRNRSARRSR